MEKIYEMLWDCAACGTKKLLGKTHRHCPSCGSPQDPTRRYFPSDAEKVAVEDHVFVGVDRICPACQAPASAAAQHCGGCGAPLAGGKEVVRRDDQVGDAFAGETAADAKREHAEHKAHAAGGGQGNPPPLPPKSRRGLLIGAAVAATVIAGLVVAFGWTKEQQVRVEGHSWTREIEIEAFGPVSDSSWCDSMPVGAYRVSRSREVRSHIDVADGEECHTRRRDRGDGTFSESEECHTKYRSEPVYDDRCRFVVDRWHRVRSVESSGGAPSEPRAWPNVTLARTGTCIGCEREGPRHEAYKVDLVEVVNGAKHSCAYPEERWAQLAPASLWRMDVAVISGYAPCDSLK